MESKRNRENITRRPSEVCVVLNDNPEYWMTQLPEQLKKIPITQLAIPGSHDTMTYTIERDNDIGPGVSPFIKTLGRYFSFFVKPVILNWSITQDVDIVQQLNSGIRYFDLRVATKPQDKDIYFVHNLYGSEITKPLQDVATWLSLHTNEVVILDFQHLYNFTEMDHCHLIENIMKIFCGPCLKLCPFSCLRDPFKHITLEWLIREQCRIFVIYRDNYVSMCKLLWPSYAWCTPWPDTVDVNKMIDILNSDLQNRSLCSAFISQCLLTPNTSYILTHLFGNLQKNLTSLCEKAVLSWINEKRPGSGGLNIVIADFVSDNNFLFSKIVIQNNTKLLP